MDFVGQRLNTSETFIFILAAGDFKQTDGHSTGKMPLSLIIAIAFTSVIVLIILSTTIICIYFWRRRIGTRQGKLVTINHCLFYPKLPKFKSSLTWLAHKWVIQLIYLKSENGEIAQKSPVFHVYNNERRVKDLIEAGRFKENDAKGIDVPFFDLESILTATDCFSSANKLGQGGFGPVYKVMIHFFTLC